METQVLVKLSEEVYAKLAASLPPPAVTTQTTELLAGYQLGVQAVLQKLREGYVISR